MLQYISPITFSGNILPKLHNVNGLVNPRIKILFFTMRFSTLFVIALVLVAVFAISANADPDPYPEPWNRQKWGNTWNNVKKTGRRLVSNFERFTFASDFLSL